MEKFRSLENMLKLETAVSGLITTILTCMSYHATSAEEFGLAMIILAFIFSCALVILLFLDKVPTTALFSKIDMITHIVFAILLVVAWILFVKNTVDLSKAGNSIITRALALIFWITNVITYGVIGFIIFKK